MTLGKTIKLSVVQLSNLKNRKNNNAFIEHYVPGTLPLTLRVLIYLALIVTLLGRYLSDLLHSVEN